MAMSFCGADLCFSGGANRNFCKEVAVWPEARPPPRDRRARELSRVDRIPGEVDRRWRLARGAEFQNIYSLPSSTVMKLKRSANSHRAAVSGPRAWAVGLVGRWRS